MVRTDAVVIGAGPAGLFAVFELGLVGVAGVHVIDSLPVPGGQCAELYADKPIYDIPGLPFCTGRELVDRLLAQVAPMQPVMHLGDEVTAFARTAQGRFAIGTAGGLRFDTASVVIAAGVGAFAPRRLRLPGLEAFEGSQVFHAPGLDPAFALPPAAAPHVIVAGGGEAAVAAALALASARAASAASPGAAPVVLLHRRDQFDAAAPALAALAAARAAGQVRVVAGGAVGFDLSREGRLVALRVADAEGQELAVPADALVVRLGLSPRLGPLAQWGLAMEKKQLVVETSCFATAEPGVFAIGDIVTYPGKRKLILSGFHEATLAAFGVAAHLRGGEPVPLEYTTTSKRLHAVLGVAPGDTPAGG